MKTVKMTTPQSSGHVDLSNPRSLLCTVGLKLNQLTLDKYDKFYPVFHCLNSPEVRDMCIPGFVQKIMLCARIPENANNNNKIVAYLCRQLYDDWKKNETAAVSSEASEADGNPGVDFKTLLLTECRRAIFEDREEAMGKVVSKNEERGGSASDLQSEMIKARDRYKAVACFTGLLYLAELVSDSLMAQIVFNLIDSQLEEKIICFCEVMTLVGNTYPLLEGGVGVAVGERLLKCCEASSAKDILRRMAEVTGMFKNSNALSMHTFRLEDTQELVAEWEVRRQQQQQQQHMRTVDSVKSGGGGGGAEDSGGGRKVTSQPPHLACPTTTPTFIKQRGGPTTPTSAEVETLELTTAKGLTWESDLPSIIAAILAFPNNADVQANGWYCLSCALKIPEDTLSAAAAGMIEANVAALKTHVTNAKVAGWACWALCFLSNQDTKKQFVDLDAIEAIAAAMSANPDALDVQGYGLSAFTIGFCQGMVTYESRVKDAALPLIEAASVSPNAAIKMKATSLLQKMNAV